MATTTTGSNPGVNNWMFDATMHQAWIGTYTPGSLGRMIQVSADCAAASSGGTGGAVAWENVTGAPLATTTDAMGAGSGTSGATHVTNGDVPFGSGDSWQFGFFASKGVWCIYHTDGGLTQVKASAISAANGGTNVSAYGSGAGSMTAFGTYFIVETYVRRSNAWVKGFWWVRRSGAWTEPPIYVRRSGGWTQVGQLIQRRELDWKRELEGLAVWPDGQQEPVLLRWDYDQPRYIGSGYPGDPARKIIYLPKPRVYELQRAA